MFPELPQGMRCHSYHGVAVPGSGNLRTSRAFKNPASTLGSCPWHLGNIHFSNDFTQFTVHLSKLILHGEVYTTIGTRS